jgi:hypothetical protein
VCVLSFAAAALLVGAVHDASAQATRTWVSGVGDDANPCSRTAPCKTFAGAISKTAANGEINCLDPGGFGGVTITKSISIVCTGVIGGVLASGANGIVINALASDTVLLDGIEVEGVGAGLDGIRIVGGGRTTIRNVAVRNFTGYGINLTAAAFARVFLDNVLLLHNGGGLNVQGSGPGVPNYAVLHDVVMDNNITVGARLSGPSYALFDTTVITGSPASVLLLSGASAGTNGNNVLRPVPAGLAPQPLD